MVGLLVSAGQVGAAPALPNGSGDTLGLIASGAIQPFWALGANITLIEITSPVGFNPFGHVVFFDANCTRDFSIPIDLTINDVLIFSVDDFIPAPAYNGLAVIVASLNHLTAIPLRNAVHVRGRWINIALDFIREVTPITLQHAETVPVQTWNPMRSAASFGAPLEDALFHTEIFLNCPSAAVVAEVPVAAGFPVSPLFAFAFTKSTALINGVIYDSDEFPLRDIRIPCTCQSMFPLLDLNPVYGDPSVFFPGQQQLFYTELVTYSLFQADVVTVAANPPTFQGYRSITVTSGVWPGGTADDFGGLNNGSAAAYQGIVAPGFR
jgi:hypothetical protein